MSEVHDREREARRLAFQRIVAYARGLDDLGAAWGALDAYRDAVAAHHRAEGERLVRELENSRAELAEVTHKRVLAENELQRAEAALRQIRDGYWMVSDSDRNRLKSICDIAARALSGARP